MQTRPGPTGYQKLPGPAGCGSRARSESAASGGYGSTSGRSSVAPPFTGRRTTLDTGRTGARSARPGAPSRTLMRARTIAPAAQHANADTAAPPVLSCSAQGRKRGSPRRPFGPGWNAVVPEDVDGEAAVLVERG